SGQKVDQMKLQLTLDRLTETERYDIAEKTTISTDVGEIGTGAIKVYGMAISRNMRERVQEKWILYDSKTYDAGKHEAEHALEDGADITAVMAFATASTISDMIGVAREKDKRVMVDLLQVSSGYTITALNDLGADLMSLHLGKDQQQKGSFQTESFSLVNGHGVGVAVAGGVNLETLPAIVQEKPDIIIVGSAITRAKNPKQAAADMKQLMQ